ncbi:MAG TPA: NAD(P)/FAD-dependent oxidoreductase, partial [Gammaproteobacteria bacterium]
MRDCDVLVVGGGPAGSSLAWALRERGLDVVLVDRSAFPRDKVCAGWVTPPVVDALGLDLDDYAAGGRTLQPLHGFRIGLLGGTPLTTRRARRPLSYGIRRCEFDHYLLERAPAEKYLGAACRAFSRDGARWQVDGTWRCRLLVGAGGHFCPVARQLSGSKEPAASVVSAQEIEFHLAPGEAAASPVEPTVPELYFTPDLAGYGWVFRKGDWLNVGLGCLGGGQLGARARDFRDWLLRQGRIPASTPERWHGHAYLLYPTAPRPLLDDGVLLVGD